MATETQELLKELQAQFAAQGQQLDNESLFNLVRQLQDRDQHDWCEAAGQSEPLTTRLKNLLKDYPADVGLFKEMVQNADDAGATRVHFVWDARKLGRESLLSPEMAAWQTNCLWAYNDALFTEQDFEAICRLGVGGKRSSSERIGRFGLGFNSVYNLTDVPSILSDSMVLFLDPHVSHLSKMGASTQKPGIKLRFLKVNVLDRFRDQFAPYHNLLGCDLESSSPFKGTLIRIPFRTKESAAKSEISQIIVSEEMVKALSLQFKAEAFQWLLFLQNVQEISMSRLMSDTDSAVSVRLETVFSVSLGRALLTKRPSLVTCGSSGRGTTVSMQLEVLCSEDTAEDTATKKYHLFTQTQHGFRSRVCLAVPLRDAEAGEAWSHDEVGRVFCFLPLPRNIDLGLRLHVHAPLNMAQDRRSVLLDERIGESEQELVRHNFKLLDDLIPSALMACLQDLALKRNQMPPSHFFWLFPVLHSRTRSQGNPADRIAQTFYARLLASGAASCPLPVAAPASNRKQQTRMDAPPAYWVKVSDCIFVPSGKEAEHVAPALLDSVVECLLRCGIQLVDAPVKVLESLIHSQAGPGTNGALTILTPAWLRQRLRSEGSMQSHALNRTPAVDLFGQLTPTDVADLLEFAVSDGEMADLRGVPLLMCEDETMVHPFAESGSTVFFPQTPLERRLFPSKDGRKLVLATKFEARPLLWAKFKQLAHAGQTVAGLPGEARSSDTKETRQERQAETAKASLGKKAFQCQFVTFPLLVKALQMLLPKTWNNPVPRIPLRDYTEWVEDWLQAMWKWLDEKEVDLFQMVHWPLIPSVGENVDLVRIPEPHKLVLVSAVSRPPVSQAQGGYPHPPPPPPPPRGQASAATPSQPTSDTRAKAEASVCEPTEPLPLRGADDDSEPAKLALVQELLQTRLHCRPIYEPTWLSQHHAKQLRTCVHASSPEGLLRSMHFASRILCACQPKPMTPSQALHMSLIARELSPKAVSALLFVATRVQKEGCSCEVDGSNGSWKCKCEVLRGLPILCRFNQSNQHVSLSGTGESQDFWVLPETCPQVLAALRAAQVDLRTCTEIPDKVLATLSASENLAVSSLLRELSLPRLKWSELLLKHVFPWAANKSKDPSVRQALMRAVVYHWRDMELTGQSSCTEALQHIPFISTLGGSMLSAAEALDPAVEKLLALYGPGDIKGPFPEARWQSAECRAVLQYRSDLSYQELSERLGFLHHLEVERREDSSACAHGAGRSTSAPEDGPVPKAVVTVAHALLRYVCETVSPAMAEKDQDGQPPADRDGLWGMFSGILGEVRPKELAKGALFSEDELMSIHSKLRRCFWLPPLAAPSGWPADAPWKGSLCGLCSAEEVRLMSEEFLVGMVRPLVGLTSGTGSAMRLPRRLLESLGLEEKPPEGLMKEQLRKMEEWSRSLTDAKRDVHASWITRCLYDHLYPTLLHAASVEEFQKDKSKQLWVPQGGFLPLARIARQSIDFPPYLLKAPAEWKEKVPHLWAKIKETFGVADCSEALQCISDAKQSSQLDPQSLDIAVRLVMAITDYLQQERAETAGATAAAGSKLDILMPTSESHLRAARDCVFNNMTWLPDVETADLNLGSYCLVHPKISHAVAHTCGCRGLSMVYTSEATEMHGADWCEAAGQSEPITTRLKNLLKDYPADISMFKELVQNADDAGATEVHFVWDWRQHRKQSLLTPDMDRWQGPALWIFNNAQFSSKDFDSICRLGVGGKRDQQRKIGRFGLGFNSVYNFTDLPSILSGDMVLFLDPHVHHLSAMGASVQKPGIKLRFLKIRVLEKFRDQFEPYHGMMGCNLSSSEPFDGTLIRVPFRSAEVAKASEVSSIQLGGDAAAMLSSHFQKEAFQWLLFLQHVAKISLSEIREGSSDMHPLCEVRLTPSVPTAPSGPSDNAEEMKDKRTPKRLSAIGSDHVVADVSIHSETFSPGHGRTFSYRLVGGASDGGVFEQVCAAIPLDVKEDRAQLRREEGRLFCFLPLPSTAISLRLAVHMHAPLNTTQDRRNVLLDHRVGDNEIINKNVRLLDERIPECLARCAANISKNAPQDFFSVFPTLHRTTGGKSGDQKRLPEIGVADRVAQAFYSLLVRRPEAIFPTLAPEAVKKYVTFGEVVFCSDREAKVSTGGPPDQASALLERVSRCLSRFGVSVVKMPLPVLESFEQVLHPALPRVLTPAWLRQFLRNMSASSVPGKYRGFRFQEAVDGEQDCQAKEHDQLPRLTADEAVALMDFAMADNNLVDLQGVPLLFTEDLKMGTLPFSAKMSTLFVPEEDEEYQLLPQAPRRLLSKKIRASRPWVWQSLQRMASSEAEPSGEKQGDESCFQLRKMTVNPLMSALQELLPKSWNVKIPEVTNDDWAWVETWLRTLWNWLSRMSVPTKKMLHWPIVPSVREPDETQVHEGKNSAGEAGEVAEAPPIRTVRLYRLLPNSTLFNARPTQSAESTSSGLLDGHLGKDLVELMEKIHCTPVWLPDWLRNRESQLAGFVHPGTADGLMKACHNLLHQLPKKGDQDTKEGDHSPASKLRKKWCPNSKQQSALAAWLVMAGPEHCDCPRVAPVGSDVGWRLNCEIFRAAPLFSPFSRKELVALVDSQSGHGGQDGSRHWSLLPEACPEVAAALRASDIPMPGCVEPADAENVAALVRELHMPRLTWAEVLLEHVFPWASTNTVQPAARQGLMLAVVQRWREMELAGHEQCVEALQQVSFIPSVDGPMRSPSTLLDPRKEELKLLYMGEGPFPATEVNAVLLPLLQRGLLRFREELSLKELHERLTFLDRKHELEETSSAEWDKVRACADSFLQYVATNVSIKCQEVARSAAAAVPVAGDPLPPAATAVERKYQSFFAWPLAMPDFLSTSSAKSGPAMPDSLAKKEEWSEDDVEQLKCQLRRCRWMPAAKAPREWLEAICWAGSAHRLWRPSDLVLMSEFWVSGAANPLLDPETQVVFSSEKKERLLSDFLKLVGISKDYPESERVKRAWAQLEAIRSWLEVNPRNERKDSEAESAWISNCLYQHVYPLIASEFQVESDPDPERQYLKDIFVAGAFVPLEDLSVSQDFHLARLYQIPKELQSTASRLCSQVRPSFHAKDLARGLHRLSGSPQLTHVETDTAVHLAMALSERVRTDGEPLPERVMLPTSQGKLRLAHECVFNNMPWLSEEEQQKRSRAVTQRGLHWVHPSISNDVAGTLKVQALSTQVAAEALAAADDGEKDPEWFEAAGQTEPLTTRLRSLLRDISSDSEDLGLFKSLLQNADDAQAKEVHFVWDWRSFGKQSLMSPEMARWQGPCLWAHNNASFSPQDFENITQLGAVKTKNKAQIGRFGLGFNSVYSVTDLPSILSDDVVLFLDPHVQHLRAMGASPAKPGIKLRFLKIDVLDKFRDQFEPYHGMFGCDLASSTPYQGTLIRLPFRTAESAAASEISKTVLAPKAAMAFLRAFRNAAAECLMFLQHVQRIEFIWIPPDGNAKPTIMELKIVPPGIPVSLPCGAAEQASQATVTEVSTAEQALEYRRLFSSRTVAQSKEKQSFISEMLSRLGMSKPDSSGNVTTVASHISFNLVISISWSPSTELQKEFHTKPGDRKEAWRLILQHDNLEDERWKMSGADEGFDYVPFAGLALCLSRQLRAKEPRICCFLPLPVNANCSLPFLINGNFCLSDPTAPGRLDLARGSSDGASTWNTLLLRNMIEPLICALIQDQAKKLQVGSTTFRSDVAAWTEDVCSLMPQKSQLPSSLKELLNLPSIYKTLGGSKLFPLAFKTGAQPLADFLGSKEPLLSYVDSVQPLEDTVATPEERQAVHEYLSSEVNAFRFCHVTPEVAQEFSFAGLQRKAKVEQSLLLHCLQKDLQCKYTCSTASKLLSFLLADDSSSVATSLQGLKLAPLCDGKVASFGKEGSDPVLCCAFAFTHAARSSFAQRVLQALAPKETLDLSGIDQASLNNLRQHANQLGIRQVETCEQLASALLSGFPNLRAPPKSRTLAGASVLESLDETLGGRLLAGSSRQATAASLFGFGNDASANATLCALWSFVELAEDGFSDQFLSDFDRFYVVPAWDPNHRPFTEPGSATAVEMPLVLVPLSASEPLLLPECDESLKPLMEIAAALVPDRFVDKGHPAMSDPVLQFLKQTGVLHHFSRGSFLRVLGSSEGSLGRCQRLNPQQRVLLRSQLCQALCDPIDDGQSQAMARASVVCKLPIFLAESATDESNAQAFRPLLQLAVVDGEPLTLTSPPVRLDLDTVFVFLASAKTHREVAEALKLPEVKEIMTEEGKYFDVKTWLQKQVVPHLESMIPEDQVIVLERLLPLIQEIPEANNEPYLIPAEARSKMMKPPLLILDPQDFTIQEIFGIRGEDWPALDLRHRYQFPSKALPASVLSHLRRLGMRRSIGDGACLAFLCQALKDQHSQLPRKRYGELQRGLMQRIVESWHTIPEGTLRELVLQQAFVDASDADEMCESLFGLKPFSASNELFKLSDLVSRSHHLDPYLCWTSLPLTPRGFPDFEEYRCPTLKDVVAHAQALGSLDAASIPLQHWQDFKEKVVRPMCEWLFHHEVFQSSDGQLPPGGVQVCSRLRKTKFIAVPLDAGSTGPCRHTLVAPWRISLVLKEHRPPMFALPDYLMDQVPVLRMLGVRDAVELPQESGHETGNSRVADEAMAWLFEHGCESFSDVTVRCDGGSLFLHRNILMSRSEYFKAMFQGGSGFLESQNASAEVSLLEFPLEVAQILFGFLYHGKVDERPLEGPEATSNSVDLMCLADQLGVPRLFEFAQLWVANQQDLEDCAEMLKLASRHRAELLERATLSLMAANLDSPEVEQQLPHLPEDQRKRLEELAKKPRTS